MSDANLPSTVLGREIPEHIRHPAPDADPAGVLAAFVEWLEQQLDAVTPGAAASVAVPRRPPRAGAAAERKHAAAEKAAADAAAAERARLVELCVDLHERLPGEGLRERVTHTLEQVGVELLTGANERFDPLLHEAAGDTPTADEQLDDVVASTQRLGYRDHDRLVREPVVLIYRFDGHDG